MQAITDISTVLDAFKDADQRLTHDPVNHTRLELKNTTSGAYLSLYVTSIDNKVVVTLTGPRHHSKPMPPASLPVKRRVVHSRVSEPLAVLVNRVVKTLLPVAAKQIDL